MARGWQCSSPIPTHSVSKSSIRSSSVVFSLLLLASAPLYESVAVAGPAARNGQVQPVVRREASEYAGCENDDVQGRGEVRDDHALLQRRVQVPRDFSSAAAGGDSLVELGAEASAALAALATRMDDSIDATLRRHNSSTGDGGKVLFVVYSGSQFYTSRVKWLVETWASSLVPSDLVVVSDRLPNTDAERAGVGFATIHATACQANSHEKGMCCKLGEAAVLAAAFLNKHPKYQWAYLSDDDVYVRPDALQRHLEEQAPTQTPGRVLGLFGCETDRCLNGLCGGGGYAADVSAMTTLVSSARGGTSGFLKEAMRNCDKCSGWADLAMSETFHARGLEMRRLLGARAFRMKKPCFDKVLVEASAEPLEFHYIVSESQMRLLHNLFTGTEVAPSASMAPERCVSFHGRTACADSPEPVDMPWEQWNASESLTC